MSDSDLLDTVDRPVSRKAAARASRKQDRTDKQPGSKPLEAKTQTQKTYLTHLKAGRDVFAVGGAGTGKTYIAARMAAKGLKEGKFEKIILARCAVSKPKHNLGFLPGNIDAKMKPWVTPVIDGLRAEVSGAQLDAWKTEGKFEIVPFEHMRGRTFNNAFIILDEAQNADFSDLNLFLTRTGENAQLVITGDLDQIDIHNSGLCEIIDVALDNDVPMEVVRFSEDDVVRSAAAKAWVKAFARHKRLKEAANDVTLVDSPPAFLRR